MLSFVLTVVAVSFGALLVLLALLVLMPLHASAEGAVSDVGLHGVLEVLWGLGVVRFAVDASGARVFLFGLGGWRVRGGEDEEKEKKRKEKKEGKEKKAKKRPGEMRRRTRAALSHRKTLLGMGKRLLAHLHVHGNIRGRVGLDDPAAAASLFAIISALALAMPRGAVGVEVSFVDDVIDLEGELGLRLWPAELLLVSVSFLFERRTWAVIRAMH